MTIANFKFNGGGANESVPPHFMIKTQKRRRKQVNEETRIGRKERV